MPRPFIVRTDLATPGLTVLRAHRVDWPLVDDMHLPRRGSKKRAWLDQLDVPGCRPDFLPEYLPAAYEVRVGDDQVIGVCIRPPWAGLVPSGEWLVYRRGRCVGDSTHIRYATLSLTAGARELARREERSIRDWGRRRRANAADVAALDGLVAYS